MKKCLSISFALLILATASPTNQGIETILKMGQFFHHFLHHLSCNQENIGIVDYVMLHYAEHEHHEGDQAGHENLPFQHHQDPHNLAPQSPCLVPPYAEIGTLLKLETYSNPLTVCAESWQSASYLDNIWQPPKA